MHLTTYFSFIYQFLSFSSLYIKNFGILKIKLPTSIGLYKKQENSKRTISASVTTPKPLTVWITTNCGKFLKRWEHQPTLPASWEVYMQVKKQQLEPDMEQGTGSKLGKEYVKAVYCQLAYLTYMQSISCEVLGWMKHKMESRLQREISKTSDMQMTPPLWLKAKRNSRASYESERGEWKSGLKLNIQKMKIMASGSMANRWGNNGNSDRLYFLRGLQNQYRWRLQPWN